MKKRQPSWLPFALGGLPAGEWAGLRPLHQSGELPDCDSGNHAHEGEGENVDGQVVLDLGRYVLDPHILGHNFEYVNTGSYLYQDRHGESDGPEEDRLALVARHSFAPISILAYFNVFVKHFLNHAKIGL